MTRFLLALLAMLTGITVAGQPVAAHVCAEEASAVRTVDCAVIAEGTSERALPSEPMGSAPDQRIAGSTWHRAVAAIPTPAVRIRCDRALE